MLRLGRIDRGARELCRLGAARRRYDKRASVDVKGEPPQSLNDDFREPLRVPMRRFSRHSPGEAQHADCPFSRSPMEPVAADSDRAPDDLPERTALDVTVAAVGAGRRGRDTGRRSWRSRGRRSRPGLNQPDVAGNVGGDERRSVRC